MLIFLVQAGPVYWKTHHLFGQKTDKQAIKCMNYFQNVFSQIITQFTQTRCALKLEYAMSIYQIEVLRL